MGRFTVHIRDKNLWETHDGTSVRGNAFEDNNLKNTTELVELFAAIRSTGEFLSALQRLNGFYAVIRENDYGLFAAVDRIRSIPLFYSRGNGYFYISDDAYWVRDQVGDKNFEEIAETEFLLTGCVTGPDTLYPNVKQLQAGEAITVEYGSEGSRISTYRYYRYIHACQMDAAEEELLERHDEVALNIFRRLIRLANGRPIVVPLSGGYDSRLIALMLKRLGYENVIAFTYGRPGNEESQISKEVAQNLNIGWEFVPYSNEDWYRWFQSENRHSYYRMADGLGSVPHIQDWPAVWMLKKDGLLPEDAIIVPGHHAPISTPAGWTIPWDFGKRRYVGENHFIETIWTKYYNLWHWNKRDPRLEKPLRRRVIDRTELNRFDSPDDVATGILKWNWQERIAKFMVNSIRVYEFFGYDWWLPLCDNEFLDFWSAVPLRYLFKKWLFNSYVRRLSHKIACMDLTPAKSFGKGTIMSPVTNLVCKMGFFSQALTLYYCMKYSMKSREYDNHPLAFYGILPKKQFAKLYTGRENINSFLALERLGRIFFTAPNP